MAQVEHQIDRDAPRFLDFAAAAAALLWNKVIEPVFQLPILAHRHANFAAYQAVAAARETNPDTPVAAAVEVAAVVEGKYVGRLHHQVVLERAVDKYPVPPTGPIGPKIANFMNSAREIGNLSRCGSVSYRLDVVVVVQPVVDHTPLKSPVVGPFEDASGNEELVAVGRTWIDDIVAGEVALRGLCANLPAPIEDSQGSAEVESLVNAEIAVSPLIQGALKALNAREYL